MTSSTADASKAAASKPAAQPVRVRPAAKSGKPASKPAVSTKAVSGKAVPAKAVPAKAAEPKPAKVKLVRDSFTMPSDEYAALAILKQRALAAAHPVKKSELLRAGIKLLAGLSDAALLRALKNVPAIKTGRPKSKKGE